MNLTIGKLEEMLRGYDRSTIVNVGCNCCNRGGTGESMLSITDRTDQTYGYIELNLNATHYGDVELNDDKEEFYSKEIEKLKNKISKLQQDIKLYDGLKESIIKTLSNYESVKEYIK